MVGELPRSGTDCSDPGWTDTVNLGLKLARGVLFTLAVVERGHIIITVPGDGVGVFCPHGGSV